MRDAAYKARDAARGRNKRQRLAFARGSKCHARLGPYAICGGRLVDAVDWLGRLAVHCPLCERKRVGLCRLCPRPVNGKVGWAVYCAGCKRGPVLSAQNQRWVRNNRRHKNALNRAARKRRAQRRSDG